MQQQKLDLSLSVLAQGDVDCSEDDNTDGEHTQSDRDARRVQQEKRETFLAQHEIISWNLLFLFRFFRSLYVEQNR